eukprot:TRINITY_DN5125_c0_g1_i1.p1 TRINITY_DN5125_c0_g1~~TRINITY_DN5125_c0_g1_i1.p1  ORF type:complete len:317 (-),score=44.03 TRINITY_DN5125_c0_g1_i1:21-971(-)
MQLLNTNYSALLDGDVTLPLWISGSESSSRFTYTEAFVLCLAPFLYHQVLFWGYSIALLIFADRPGFKLEKSAKDSPWALRYKLQPNAGVTWSELFKCVRVVLRNQFLLMLPFSLIQGPFLRRSSSHLKAFASDPFSALGIAGAGATIEWPAWYIVFLQLLACHFIEEIGFYYSHRALHHSRIYKWIHKQHHEFKAPIGMAAEYAHPFEFAVSNLVPITTPPLLLSFLLGPDLGGFHPLTLFLWYTINIYGTISHHCGYTFPWLLAGLNPTFHDDHHRLFNANYGLNGFCDWLHSTKAEHTCASLKSKAVASKRAE